MKVNFRLKKLVLAIGLACPFALAQAVDLPPALQSELQNVPGLTVQTDGSIQAGNTTFIPILPPGYDPNTAGVGLGDFQQQADGSYVANNMQFAPVTPPQPGALPQLPENFVPLEGNSLPADFKPPAGFVPNDKLPLPEGVTVPPKNPADLVKDMESAGVLPAGEVTFNPDGSVTLASSDKPLFLLLPLLTNKDSIIPQLVQRGLREQPMVLLRFQMVPN